MEWHQERIGSFEEFESIRLMDVADGVPLVIGTMDGREYPVFCGTRYQDMFEIVHARISPDDKIPVCIGYHERDSDEATIQFGNNGMALGESYQGISHYCPLLFFKGKPLFVLRERADSGNCALMHGKSAIAIGEISTVSMIDGEPCYAREDPDSGNWSVVWGDVRCVLGTGQPFESMACVTEVVARRMNGALEFLSVVEMGETISDFLVRNLFYEMDSPYSHIAGGGFNRIVQNVKVETTGFLRYIEADRSTNPWAWRLVECAGLEQIRVRPIEGRFNRHGRNAQLIRDFDIMDGVLALLIQEGEEESMAKTWVRIDNGDSPVFDEILSDSFGFLPGTRSLQFVARRGKEVFRVTGTM